MTATAPVASQPLIPPEEKFWQRYSPHNEAPLSGVASTVIHALVIGLLLLIVYIHSMTKVDDANRPLPVDVMKVGAGKGDEPGVGGEGPGGGKKIDQEGNGDKRPIPPPIVKISPAKARAIEQELPNDPTAKQLSERPTMPFSDLFALEKEARQTLRRGINPGGGNGPGKDKSGGGGDGIPRINDVEEDLLRWEVTFQTSSGGDYLAQLAGLGAKIGIPIQGSEGQFLLVEDLRNPTAAVRKDVAQLGMIYWIDQKPESVRSLYSVVPHQQPSQPSYFVAFFPKTIHDRLFALEMDYAVRNRGGLRDKKKIHLTQFDVFPSGARYDFRVRAMHLKP